MPRLPVAPHHTARPAWAPYRACRHRPGLLPRAAEPRTPAPAAAAGGVPVLTARAALRRWDGRGPAAAGGRAWYDRLDVSGFARPETGRAFRAPRPRVNAERLADAPAAFAAHADPAGRE